MTALVATARRYVDASSVLTLFLILGAVPTYLTITVVGAIGRPIVLVSLGMLAWWLAHQVQRPFGAEPATQPLRWILLAFVIAVVASYASAMFRGLPADELSPAGTGVLRVASWCGLFLVAHDGLRSWSSLLTMLRRVATAGGLIAALGLAQFATKNSLLGWLSIPGMSGDGLGGIDMRGGFVRAAGTAAHPLEYGMVLCMTLPIAMTLAMEDKERGALSRWWPAALITTASAISVSRSALIALVVAMTVLFITWSRKQRWAAVASAMVVGALVYLAVPGMAGTIVGLFSGAAQDSSVVSRVSGYDVAFGMVERLPVFGRGFGTLLPTYVYLDNQYLGIIVELGLAGLACVVALFATGALLAWRARRSARSHVEEQVGVALTAAICAGATSFAFFDALSFPMSASFIFLVLGLAGAYRRILRTGRPEANEATVRRGAGPRHLGGTL